VSAKRSWEFYPGALNKFLEAKNIQWLFFLLATVTFSIVGVLFPNWFKEVASPRAHNRLKLLNECLARSQFAYFSYFFAVAIAADFDPKHSWIRYLTCLKHFMVKLFGSIQATTLHQNRGRAIFAPALTIHATSKKDADGSQGCGEHESTVVTPHKTSTAHLRPQSTRY
jgi:hypothetical protein